MCVHVDICTRVSMSYDSEESDKSLPIAKRGGETLVEDQGAAESTVSSLTVSC
jgi:hypothetical protein